jgi:nucleoside-diphosphate-sugar epimerase
MIHASDLADALVTLCDKSNGQAIVEIDDGKKGGYTVKDVANALPDADSKTVRAIPIPFPVLGTIGALNGMVATAINRPAMLTLSTAKYLSHPDWTVKEPRRFNHAKWSPQFDLKAGLLDTIEWYRKNDLL